MIKHLFNLAQYPLWAILRSSINELATYSRGHLNAKYNLWHFKLVALILLTSPHSRRRIIALIFKFNSKYCFCYLEFIPIEVVDYIGVHLSSQCAYYLPQSEEVNSFHHSLVVLATTLPTVYYLVSLESTWSVPVLNIVFYSSNKLLRWWAQSYTIRSHYNKLSFGTPLIWSIPIINPTHVTFAVT